MRTQADAGLSNAVKPASGYRLTDAGGGKMITVVRTDVITLMGVWLAVAHAAAAGQPPPPANDLPALVHDRRQRMGRTVEVTFTSTKSCWLTPSALADWVRRVGPYPDHPERGRLDYLRQLAASPEIRTITIVWSGLPGGAARCWRMDQPAPSSSSPGGSPPAILAGGDREHRWMWARMQDVGQLTITRSDVPFPASFNIGRFAELAREYTSIVAAGGLGMLSDQAVGAVDKQSTALSRRYTIDDPAINRAYLLICRGIEGHGGEFPAEVTEFSPREAFEAGRPSCTIRMEGFAAMEALGGVAATRIRIDDADGLREEIVVRDVRSLSADEATAATRVPEVQEGTHVLDFRDPHSSAWGSYASSPRMTWTASGTADEYAMDDPTASAVKRAPAPGQSWVSRSLILTVGSALLLLLSVAVLRKHLQRSAA